MAGWRCKPPDRAQGCFLSTRFPRYACRVTEQDRRPTTPSRAPHHDDGPPASAVALVLGAIAIACVLGYLLIMKLAAMGHAENCILAHRHNCDVPIEMQ